LPADVFWNAGMIVENATVGVEYATSESVVPSFEEVAADEPPPATSAATAASAVSNKASGRCGKETSRLFRLT
jgi:hypothetical protein